MNRVALALTAMLLASCGGVPSGPVERFTVPEGASLSQVEDSLAAHRLLGWRPWFRIVAKVGRFERDLKPGIYEFAPGTSALAILRDIRNANFLRLKLTVPEGFTSIDIAALVASRFPTGRDSVLAAIRDPDLLREYAIPAPTAEGFMAPDTYTIAAHSSARDVVKVLLDQFQAGWDASWDSALAARKLSRLQAVTLASIVEGEARVDEERPVIAAVYLNRLRIGMPLQADPTVQYAIQLETGARKPRLIFADYRVKSPYNTYLFAGLPPGPVGNPGRKSLEAIVSPASVPYLYFVATGDGRHTFSRTYGEHLRAIARSRRASK
jgi:UPF0755 protein